MTPLFLTRLFEERSSVCTSCGRAVEGRREPNRMDYAAFLRFVFAWEHRDEPAALRFFFPLFDLEGKGCISQVIHVNFTCGLMGVHIAFCQQQIELGGNDC